jgi:hypothetical protein
MEMKKENESKENGKIFFRHIRYMKDGKVQNMGGVTIAYQEVVPGSIKIAIAMCSNKDNFHRKMGRIISSGRLNSPNKSVIVDMDWDSFIKTIPYDMSQFDNATKKV